jgi:TPR repeat protein
MSLEHIVPNASVERGHYHQLAARELDKLDDAEARYERGWRLRKGIGVEKDEEEGWALIIESAKLGHPTALGICSLNGRGTTKNLKRAAELFRASADRGHATGSIFCFVKH